MVAWIAATPWTALGADEREFTESQITFFEKKVRPLLVDHCVECHGPDKQKNGLRLDSRQAALRGGESGKAIVPGDADSSLLIQAIRLHHDDDLSMPPDRPLPKDAIDILVKWVNL
ncbi:MAG: c-type cytochrome domain-containing protein, partial [Planctomycetota bacterium]